MPIPNNARALTEALLNGDRVALGRAITLAESAKAEHRQTANEILTAVIPHAGNSRRIGITGIPGAGKSTFIEVFGTRLADAGHKVAVLAVDPSGVLSKGSILGDKTRMERLSAHPGAFIRPTPSGNLLGGVAAGTADAILLCEAAGYDVILVETVGVGQSETTVRDLTDLFVLLAISGAGDELQGIKRGIMETADLVVVNKADSGNEEKARETAHRIKSALHFFPAGDRLWEVPVVCVSSVTGTGLDDFAGHVQHCFERLSENDYLQRRRQQQDKKRFLEMVNHIGLKALLQNTQVGAFIRQAEHAIETGRQTGLAAALQFEKLLREVISAGQ